MTAPIELIISQLASINCRLDKIEAAANDLQELMESGDINHVLSENLNYHNTLLDTVTSVRDLVAKSRNNGPVLCIGDKCAEMLRNLHQD